MERFRISQQEVTRIGAALMLSILSGVGIWLALPPYGVWPLAWVGWVPVLLAQYRLMPRRFSMIPPALATYIWVKGYLTPVFGGSGLFMAYLAEIVFVISLLTEGGNRRFNERTGYRWFVLQSAVGWSGVEMIRLFVPIAGTWGFIAYAHFRTPWLLQPLSIVGIVGMGFLMVLVNFALAQAVIRLWDQRWGAGDAPTPSPIATRRWLRGVGAATGVWLIVSLALFFQPLSPTRVRVAAIHTFPQPIAIFTEQPDALPALHADMIERTRAAAREGAQVILWSEVSFFHDPQEEDQLGLSSLARELGTYLGIGYGIIKDGRIWRNEATVIDPQGRFLGVFGKDHPVVFAGEISTTRGTYPVYQTSLGRMATIICYDLDYTDTAQKMARQGAQLLLIPSNDWAGIARLHYVHAMYRAIENRIPVIKADAGYDSVIMDAHGRIVASSITPEGRSALVVADVPLGSGRGTLVSHLGEWVGMLCLAAFIFFAVGGSWLEKRAAKTS